MWYNQGMNKQQGVPKSSLKQEVSYGVCVCGSTNIIILKKKKKKKKEKKTVCVYGSR